MSERLERTTTDYRVAAGSRPTTPRRDLRVLRQERDRDDADFARRYETASPAATRARARVARLRSHGQRLVVDRHLHRRADHRPQAAAPPAHGDPHLIAPPGETHQGRRGEPGGLFCCPDAGTTDHRGPPTTTRNPTSALRGSRGRRCSSPSTPKPSQRNAGGSTRGCADTSSALVELFFSEQLDDILRAKAFCQECPVREPCLDAGDRAARAVGRVGWRALREREGAGAEASAWAATEGGPARARDRGARAPLRREERLT